MGYETYKFKEQLDKAVNNKADAASKELPTTVIPEDTAALSYEQTPLPGVEVQKIPKAEHTPAGSAKS